MTTHQTYSATANAIHRLSGLALLAVSIAFSSGCYAWNPNTMPLGGAIRVPPPGTGQYPAPGGYYNNNTSYAPAGQVMQASATGGSFGPSSGGRVPMTNVPAAVSPAGFQTNGFSAPSNGSFGSMPAGGSGGQFAPVQPAGFSGYSPAPTNQVDTTSGANLSWR